MEILHTLTLIIGDWLCGITITSYFRKKPGHSNDRVLYILPQKKNSALQKILKNTVLSVMAKAQLGHFKCKYYPKFQVCQK